MHHRLIRRPARVLHLPVASLKHRTSTQKHRKHKVGLSRVNDKVAINHSSHHDSVLLPRRVRRPAPVVGSQRRIDSNQSYGVQDALGVRLQALRLRRRLRVLRQAWVGGIRMTRRRTVALAAEGREGQGTRMLGGDMEVVVVVVTEEEVVIQADLQSQQVHRGPEVMITQVAVDEVTGGRQGFRLDHELEDRDLVCLVDRDRRDSTCVFLLFLFL